MRWSQRLVEPDRIDPQNDHVTQYYATSTTDFPGTIKGPRARCTHHPAPHDSLASHAKPWRTIPRHALGAFELVCEVASSRGFCLLSRLHFRDYFSSLATDFAKRW